MSKKRFMQAVFARLVPKPDDLAATLRYAETVWTYLTTQGYGDSEPAAPRDNKDYYDLLSPRSQRYFDRFWTVFGHKRGKNNAARRWHQLGDLTDAAYQQIVDAAEAEAKRELAPGQVRKMAEGWLFERRWVDFAPAPREHKTAHHLAVNRLQNELKQLRQLHAVNPDPKLAAQIQRLDATLAEISKP